MIINQINWESGISLLKKSGYDKSLIAALDSIGSDSQLPFYFAEYRYGELVIDNGQFNTTNIDNSIADELRYTHNSPVGIVIDGCSELFYEHHDQVIPFSIFEAGNILNTDILFNQENNVPTYNFSLSAGIRSVYSAVKISESRGNNGLIKEFKLPTRSPAKLFEHWNIFKSLASAVESDWKYQVLYFPKDILNLINTIAWKPFKDELLLQKWRETEYLRKSNTIDMVNSLVASSTTHIQNIERNFLKHTFNISTGNGFAFKPVTDDKYLPFSIIKSIYLDFYYRNAKNQDFVLLIPGKESLTTENSQPLYYSFQYHTNPEFHTPRIKHSISQDLLLMSTVLDFFIEKLPSYSVPMSNLLKGIKFEFSAVEDNPQELIKADHRFLLNDSNYLNHSSLLRYFLKISRK